MERRAFALRPATPYQKPPPLERRPYINKMGWLRTCQRCGLRFVRAFVDSHCDSCIKKDGRLRWTDDEDGGQWEMPRGRRRVASSD